jgi:pilus assembly protein CpaF
MDGYDIPEFGHKHLDEPAPPPVHSPGGTTAHTESGGVLRDDADIGARSATFAHETTRSDTSRLRLIVLEKMDATAAATLPPARLLLEVERLISALASEQHVQMNGAEQRQMAAEVVDDMVGLGPLEPLLRDESINDIMVNGPDHTFVERGGKIVQVPVHFRDWQHLTNICQRIAASVGRHVDESSPMVDARLKDGSRVNIVLPPLTLDGPAIAIRKFSKKPMDFEKLIAFGSLPPAVAHILEICARCRLNIIISGGTGSGKTTMMNAMSRFIDPTERIITVEDVAELQLEQPDIVRMETKPLNLEGKGEVTTRDLVRNALRMRPDRIIVGEVRGAEAFDMLQAMNTGHAGSLSTIHANSSRDALARIENMVQMSGMGLSSKSIRTEIVGAIHLIVQLERQRDGTRRVTEVTEIAGIEGETVLLNEIFQLKITGEASDGKLLGKYHYSRIRPTFYEQLRYFNLERHWAEAMDEAANDPNMTTE